MVLDFVNHLLRGNLLVLAGVWVCAPNALAGGTLSLAAAGYVYGFPLVLMEETLNGMTGAQRSCQLGADLNTFVHVWQPPGPEFKAVVRPNVDTLYSSAMLDLSGGPMLLDMPAVADRYVLMALLDAWSNNFAGVGTQNQGVGEGHYVIVGPGWQGEAMAGLPQHYERIDAPTDLVWIIGRTEVRDDGDIAEVNRIQAQYTLTRLSSVPEPSVPESSMPADAQAALDEAAAPAGSEHCVPDGEKTPPIEVVQALSGREYFSRLSELMERYPPPPEDDAMVEALARLGVGPKALTPMQALSSRQQRQIEAGRTLGLAALNLATRLLGLNGWGPNPALVPLGDFGQRYFIRAVVAQVGFGANRGEFAVYQNAERDSRRRLLRGNAVYSMTFAADDPPPVAGFWSVTVYGEDGFLRDNAVAHQLGIQRHALGSNSDLVADEQGNITLYFANMPPVGVPLNNWLPVPEGRFQATIRLYAPDAAILDHQWRTPPLVKRRDLAP
ncbi:DUF1254 domain-containing protein [Ketobacter sp.]|uniref:DUF1254 domain-containing protein n=1 Tax=Ketobacter sp. TaxID=2083498 RepID=UPI0025B82BF5|nr:DUF1254 domain-containing protein [Ketobacter sp.]